MKDAERLARADFELAVLDVFTAARDLRPVSTYTSNAEYTRVLIVKETDWERLQNALARHAEMMQRQRKQQP